MSNETLPAADARDESQWVEGELVRSLMRSQRNAQWVDLVMIAIVAGVLWNDVLPAWTVAWALAGLALAAARRAMLGRHAREMATRPAPEQIAFFRRWRPVWAASGLVWGLTTALFFDRASLADQFICWLALAALAMYTVHTLSSQREALRDWLTALAAGVLGVVAWRMGVELQLQGPAYHWWLLALMLVFWQAMRQAGRRLHRTDRGHYELQFRNAQLIDSLTRQTQAALDAVEIKNRFLASAAHDIRQPVHALGLYADWLGSEPEMVHELAPKIVDATKAVNRLFDSLFDLARLDSGKIRLNVGPVDLGKLLRDLELQYRPLCEAKGLQFRVRAGAGSVLSDPILLQRVLGNLISNAVKYTQRGGILLAARGSRHALRLEIWDTGVGIAPVHQREIFREFYKVPTHGGTEDGFGLGLYIVARLTHILGHPLTLASRPGRGTVFRLALHPTDARAAAERAVTAVATMLR